MLSGPQTPGVPISRNITRTWAAVSSRSGQGSEAPWGSHSPSPRRSGEVCVGAVQKPGWPGRGSRAGVPGRAKPGSPGQKAGRCAALPGKRSVGAGLYRGKKPIHRAKKHTPGRDPGRCGGVTGRRSGEKAGLIGDKSTPGRGFPGDFFAEKAATGAKRAAVGRRTGAKSPRKPGLPGEKSRFPGDIVSGRDGFSGASRARTHTHGRTGGCVLRACIGRKPENGQRRRKCVLFVAVSSPFVRRLLSGLSGRKE